MRGSLCALVVGREQAAIAADSGRHVWVGPTRELATRSAELAASAAEPLRWVWWEAAAAVPALLSAGVAVQRSWDLSEAHRLLVGGFDAAPDAVWAAAHGLDPANLPQRLTGDLFDSFGGEGDEATVRSDGYLNPICLQEDWREANLGELAKLALTTAGRQQQLLADREHGVSTAAAESGAAVLCVELERTGLPMDRARLEAEITRFAGPRPDGEQEAASSRAQRDQRVLSLLPGREHLDLRNPAQVRDLLHAMGVRVDGTRAWELEPYRATNPVVDALLEWRKAERIATTYGWSWVDRFVGADDRLRGPWTACDGGAGRMTAGAGLHSLPTALRPGVAAHPGHVLVRADLGQVEPRVLAVVSGDPALAAATADDDLYATVAAQLRLDRPTAKIAVLAAMYGQTSGPAADALRRMESTYPAAMAYLRTAAGRGENGEPVTTYGGRRVPVRAGGDQSQRRAIGRFTRNAVVQGAAAELFKAWALTVREGLRALDAQIVLCLHDELLVHVPQEHAERAAAVVRDGLQASARRWSGGQQVRFVVDLRVIERWSEAKD